MLTSAYPVSYAILKNSDLWYSMDSSQQNTFLTSDLKNNLWAYERYFKSIGTSQATKYVDKCNSTANAILNSLPIVTAYRLSGYLPDFTGEFTDNANGLLKVIREKEFQVLKKSDVVYIDITATYLIGGDSNIAPSNRLQPAFKLSLRGFRQERILIGVETEFHLMAIIAYKNIIEQAKRLAEAYTNMANLPREGE